MATLCLLFCTDCPLEKEIARGKHLEDSPCEAGLALRTPWGPSHSSTVNTHRHCRRTLGVRDDDGIARALMALKMLPYSCCTVRTLYAKPPSHNTANCRI